MDEDRESLGAFLRTRRALYGFAGALALTLAASAGQIAAEADSMPPAVVDAQAIAAMTEEALCATDSDCLELCAPEDDDCDGGPQ